jgi:glutathione synthase
MSLRVAVQMDPIETINIAGDTSFAMMEEAQARGHTLWTYHPDSLAYRQGRVTAVARPVRVQRVAGDHARQGEPVQLDLAEDVDVILMRQDPPFDMHYITAAHLLELVHPKTLVVNDPAWVRSSPEKISALLFPELMPPTLVTRDIAQMRAFRAAHGDIVVKPLYGKAGEGVFLAKAEDGNFAALIELFLATRREAIMLQAFLPAVFDGDKRIILIEGEPAGVLNRKPQGTDIRSNLAAGGKAEATELSSADRAICAAIGPMLRARGLVFVGIDVIAGHLTEINVTSPTGLVAIRGLGGPDLAPPFWDAVEARRRSA